jgi:hypothetical protein
MDVGPSYDDGLVMLDDQGITLRHYYFPMASSKHIPYGEIRDVEVRDMGWLTGKGRIWGSGSLSYWLPLDRRRMRKDRLVVLHIGRRIKPAFTPAEPDVVQSIVRRHLGRA